MGSAIDVLTAAERKASLYVEFPATVCRDDIMRPAPVEEIDEYALQYCRDKSLIEVHNAISIAGFGWYEWIELTSEGRIALYEWRAQQEANREAQGTSEQLEALTDSEYTILRELRAQHPRRVLVISLQEDTSITRKTVGKALKQLAERGLVDYDAKAREGAAITTTGLELLEAESRF